MKTEEEDGGGLGENGKGEKAGERRKGRVKKEGNLMKVEI